jgi:hypothetical protein
MIKTIATFTQTTPELPQATLDNDLNQVAAWQTEGKYTGDVILTYNVDTGVRRAERWNWIDNDAALAYKNLAISTWIDLYPDVNVDIVVE